jgi:hypothetical protein
MAGRDGNVRAKIVTEKCASHVCNLIFDFRSSLSGIRQSGTGNQNWAHQDSNLGPRDYESPALTAEL